MPIQIELIGRSGSGGVSDTHVSISDDGTEVVTDAEDINFGAGLTATDDGDDSASVGLDDAIVVDQLRVDETGTAPSEAGAFRLDDGAVKVRTSGLTKDLTNIGAAGGSLSDEEVQDIVGALVVAAAESNVSVAYNDANDELVIDTTALNEEEVEDVVGVLLEGGDDISVTYDDVAGTLPIDLDDEITLDSLNLAETGLQPATAGEFTLDDGNVYVRSGGSARNLTNIGSGGAGSLTWSSVNSGTTASAGNAYAVDASSGTTEITLPASPSTGDEVVVTRDLENDPTSNTIRVDGNGGQLWDRAAVAGQLDLDRRPAYVALTWSGSIWLAQYPLSDAEVQSAINSDPDHGSTASHDYFAGNFEALGDVSSGTLGTRPAPGTAGDWYFATDGGIYYDDGGTWQTVAELDTDTQLSDAEVQTAINDDPDHGSTASHNYFSARHGDLTNVQSDQHHTKTTSASDLTDVSADSVADAHHAKTTSADIDHDSTQGGTDPDAHHIKTTSASELTDVSADSAADAHHTRPSAGVGLAEANNSFALGVRSNRPPNPPQEAVYFDDGSGSNAPGWYYTTDGGATWKSPNQAISADIDVTEEGVTLNDQSAAQANGTAMEDILLNQASDDDVILIPLEQGDVMWVEGPSPSTSVDKAIDVDKNGGLPTNLTITGQTDADGLPLGRIQTTPDTTANQFMLEVDVRGGLNWNIEHLMWDHNVRNRSGGGGSAIVLENPDTGHSNDITFLNNHFYDSADKLLSTDQVNGIHAHYCRFDTVGSNHGWDLEQNNTTEITPQCTVKFCHFVDIPGYAVNHGSGHVLIQDSVVDPSCAAAFKLDSGDIYDADYKRLRLSNSNGTSGLTIGQFNSESRSTAPTVTIEDVIIENPSGRGFWSTGPDPDIATTYRVLSNSKLIVKNSGNDAINLRSGQTIETESGAVIQICDSAQASIDYDSTASSTIDEFRGQNNADGIENNGNLTISNQTAGACDSDIASVPTAAEVGIGTQ